MPFFRRILERLPLALFLLALGSLLFGLGMAVERYNLFPRSILDDGVKTARVTAENLLTRDIGEFRHYSSTGWSDTLLADIPAQRIIAYGGGGGNALLILGGRHQFRELCPEHGCLAVAVAPSGEVAHAWPFRPNAIFAANIVDEDDYPHEQNNFSAERDVYPRGIATYPNGDLLVTFHQRNTFPYGGGVARIDRDGHPRWFRRDYSHHIPHLTEGDIAFVPSYVFESTLEAPNREGVLVHRCDVYHSVFNVLDGDGALLKQVPVLDILLASPEASVLIESSDPCDPLHLNSIDIVGEDADGLASLAPGDIVLSFRNVSAFATLDGETHEVKRLARGTFRAQHGVTHLGGATFLMLDNRGGERDSSRLLMVDLATGAETTLFPTERTPEALRLTTPFAGSIDISPDRQRAVIVFSRRGVAVEVRLADGEPLTVYRSLHDVSDLDQFSAERLSRAASFTVYDIKYLHSARWPHAAER